MEGGGQKRKALAHPGGSRQGTKRLESTRDQSISLVLKVLGAARSGM